MPTDRYRPSPDVRASMSSDGLVLLDIKGGLVLASNPIGAYIWRLLEQRCTSVEIVRRIAEEYDIPVDRACRDVLTFVASLTARGLLTPEPAC